MSSEDVGAGVVRGHRDVDWRVGEGRVCGACFVGLVIGAGRMSEVRVLICSVR